MDRAEGTFDLCFDDEPPYSDTGGVKLARAHITKTFHGDLTGTSETDIITVHTAHPAAYAGIERFEGTVGGRKGSFVLQHNAGGENGVPWMTWKIVETSGTGTSPESAVRARSSSARTAATPTPSTTSSEAQGPRPQLEDRNGTYA
jgi:hypothetical protein